MSAIERFHCIFSEFETLWGTLIRTEVVFWWWMFRDAAKIVLDKIIRISSKWQSPINLNQLLLLALSYLCLILNRSKKLTRIYFETSVIGWNLKQHKVLERNFISYVYPFSLNNGSLNQSSKHFVLTFDILFNKFQHLKNRHSNEWINLRLCF